MSVTYYTGRFDLFRSVRKDFLTTLTFLVPRFIMEQLSTAKLPNGNVTLVGVGRNEGGGVGVVVVELGFALDNGTGK